MTLSRRRGLNRRIVVIACLFNCLLTGRLFATPSWPAAFHAGTADGLLDVTASYGLGIRLDDADPDLVAVASGGGRASSNQDDGTLNYDDGVFSNALRPNTDLTLFWRDFGAYVGGFAFYDHENQRDDRARTSLSDGAKNSVARDADLLDHHVSMQQTVGGVPVVFRLGDPVVNWGETSFVPDGIDIVNPLDLSALNEPATPPPRLPAAGSSVLYLCVRY